MINRKTNDRNELCGKTGAARWNLAFQDYQGCCKLKILRKSAALMVAIPGRSEHDGK